MTSIFTRALIATALTALLCIVALTPSGASAGGSYQKCPGKVELTFGDLATNIKAKNLKCRAAKHVIKAPAEDLGYHCATIGPGGNTGRIKCTKGDRAVKFDYSQT